MDQIIEYRTYQEYKEELDGELQRAAEGFVRIGYLLKVARDTNILEESGYKSVAEFAEMEYNLDKTQVSRFIHINDRFSQGGYSDCLAEHYRGFGYAKLTLMLQLPDEINEELTPDYSKSEIQAIKEEIEEERAISDIEVILESASAAVSLEETDLQRTVKKMGEDMPELFEEMWKAYRSSWLIDRLQDIMTPEGQRIINVRIPGIGRKMLVMKDRDNGDEVVLVDVRTNEKQKYTWVELLIVCGQLVSNGMTVEDTWKNTYFTEWPMKKQEVAPVQPKEQTKKKDSKVQKAKKPEKPINTKCEEDSGENVDKEEQVEGQMEISQYPEYLPETGEEKGENAGNTECAGDTGGEEGNTVQEPDAVTGATESGGCEADHREVEEKLGDLKEEIWGEIYRKHDDLAKRLAVWDTQHALMEKEQIEVLYHLAIDMAAGLEKLMMGESS